MIRQLTTWILVLVLAGSFAVVSPGFATDDEAQKPRKAVSPETARAESPPRYSAEEQALRAIQDEGRMRVRELAEQISKETDSERRMELQQQAVEIKKQNRIQFLETLAEFARQRGDEIVEQQALDQIENIKNPPRYEGSAVNRTLDKSEARKGAK